MTLFIYRGDNVREIIEDDLISGLRSRTQIRLTGHGIEKTLITEIIEPEKEDVDDVEYENFDEEKSSLNGGGIFVYDKAIRVSADGHKIYSFNDTVITNFSFTFDCNDKGYVDNHFFMQHNVRDVTLSSMSFLEIDKYSEGSELVIICDNELVARIAIADMTTEEYQSLFINFGGYAKTKDYRSKWEIYISGNTNSYARGKFIMNCVSQPEDGINITDLITGGIEDDESEPSS